MINRSEISEEDEQTLELKAKIILDCNNGGISSFINEKKKVLLKPYKIDNRLNNEDECIEKQQEELLFYNEYGGFSRRWKGI